MNKSLFILLYFIVIHAGAMAQEDSLSLAEYDSTFLQEENWQDGRSCQKPKKSFPRDPDVREDLFALDLDAP